jgi:hypothetical protein
MSNAKVHFGLKGRTWCSAAGASSAVTSKVAEVTCNRCLGQEHVVYLSDLTDTLARSVLKAEIARWEHNAAQRAEWEREYQERCAEREREREAWAAEHPEEAARQEQERLEEEARREQQRVEHQEYMERRRQEEAEEKVRDALRHFARS